MELIHMLLNIIAPIFTFTTFFFFLPPFMFFKFFLYILRSIFSENVAGKVVLITGASSGIGEHLAYEYAKRGACLVLVARRENSLQKVANKARWLGSPDVIVIRGDVSKVEDCKRFVDEALNHFGRLDHLVNNAGIAAICMFEDSTNITNFAPVMETNFWGSVYSTYYAVPHLRKNQGKIVVIASAGGWLPAPRMTIYVASKAAVLSFYESLRVEFGRDIRITIVTPGLMESEMTKGKFLLNDGEVKVDQELRDVQMSVVPVKSAAGCAKAIVNSVCRGDAYLTEPSWVRMTLCWKAFCPEILEWCNRFFLIPELGTSDREALGKKSLDLTGAKKFVYPASIRSPEVKDN